MHKAGDHENPISPRFPFWEKHVWKTRPSHRVCAFSHLSMPIYAKFYHRQSAFSLRNMPCMRSVHKMRNMNIQQHKQKCVLNWYAVRWKHGVDPPIAPTANHCMYSDENDELSALVGSVALLVARRTNDRKVAGSRPTKVVCITVLTGNRMGANCPLWPAATPSSEL